MEAVRLDRKSNIINAYEIKPTLPYDIEGVLVEKEGKDIKIEKAIENKKVLYSIRLKEETLSKIGENIKIDKENIVSVKVEEKVEEKEDNSIDTEEIIKRLGLEDEEETKEGIKYLLNNQIPVTKENLESFLMSKRYLNEIIENIDFDTYIKLTDKGIDLKEDSLQKIAEALSYIKEDEKNYSIKKLLNLHRKLSYKEAETIAKEIYKRKMGKDVYDSIIALHKEGLPINKKNIEKAMEIVDKLHDLKDYEDKLFIKAFKDSLPINIETLYRLKHSYQIGSIDENITSNLYEQFTIEGELSIEDVLNLLKELDIENTQENINLIREFFLNGVELTKESYTKVIDMKSTLNELTELIDEEKIASLLKDEVEPLKENIDDLVEMIKNQSSAKENSNSSKIMDILKNIESLKSITDEDLLFLVKNEVDFKIENLKEIVSTNTNLNKGLNGTATEKAITISNIFNTLGNLDSNTLSYAIKRHRNITLNNLYDSHIELNTVKDLIKPIPKTEETIIRQQYLYAKDNTTLKLIKSSIKDNIEIEHMALNELNIYINKKINKYKETEKHLNEIKYLRGKENALIPIVMKNGINMSMKQLSNINSLLNSGKGIGNIFDNIVKGQAYIENRGLKEGIEILGNKIKDFTKSLKKGQDDIKEGYKNILDSFTSLGNSLNSDKRNQDENIRQIEEYLDLQRQLSKDDLVLQLPIGNKDGYKNINLIIPDAKKGIDKNNMVFYLKMDMENLGEVVLNLKVKENRIYIDFESENSNRILENSHILEEGLNKIGYILKSIEPNSKM